MIDAILRANARAVKCTTPGELYLGYLASLDSYRPDLKHRPNSTEAYRAKTYCAKIPKRRFENRHQATEVKPRLGGLRCYNCQEMGHLSRNCTKPKVDRCQNCGQVGHNKVAWQAASGSNKRPIGLGQGNSQVRMVNLDKPCIYLKYAETNGERIQVLLDTGSEQNVISAKCVKALKLGVGRPSKVILRSFGGGQCLVGGEVDLTIDMKDNQFDITAIVTDCYMSSVVILLGQPILCSLDVLLVVTIGKAKLC